VIFLNLITVCIMQREVCHLSVCWRRNKRELSVYKRTKRTELTCPSMPAGNFVTTSYSVAISEAEYSFRQLCKPYSVAISEAEYFFRQLCNTLPRSSFWNTTWRQLCNRFLCSPFWSTAYL
jgi:hypothetical protein